MKTENNNTPQLRVTKKPCEHWQAWAGDILVATIRTEDAARLIAAAPDLLAALRELFGLVEDGTLVRNTVDDAQPGWAVKQIPLVKALANAREVIARAEGNPNATVQQPYPAGRWTGKGAA